MKNNAFSPKQRLRKTRQFKRLYQARFRLVSPYFVLLAHANDIGIPRLGIVVAKKHIKLAVGRNQVKRLVRESFRHNKDLLPDQDIVIIARQLAAKASNQQIAEDLKRLWKRFGRSRKQA